MILDEITQCKRVIVPDDCFFCDEHNGQRYFTEEYRELINKVRLYQSEHFIEDRAYEKIYFSYARYVKGKTVGEEKLEEFFESQDYKIVYPERHTLEEQLNMLANCRHFGSTIGSCSHNIVFLPKKAEVVLIPRAFYLTGYQVALDEVIDLNIHYVDSSLSVLACRRKPWSGPFYYYVSENLLKYFGVSRECNGKYYKKQLIDFKKYTRNAELLTDLKERYMPEYYNRQLVYCMQKLQEAHPYRLFFMKIWLWTPKIIKTNAEIVVNKICKRLKGSG